MVLLGIYLESHSSCRYNFRQLPLSIVQNGSCLMQDFLFLSPTQSEFAAVLRVSLESSISMKETIVKVGHLTVVNRVTA